MERIVITGFSMITPLGNDIEEVWNKLCLSMHSVEDHEDLKQEGFRFTKACRVRHFDNEIEGRRGFSMALECIRQAVKQAQIKLPATTGVFVGSTMGESSAYEAAAVSNDSNLERHMISGWAADIQKAFNLRGPSMTFGSACAAGNYAIGTAATYMRKTGVQVAVAGCAEPFSRIAMTGFSRSRAMTNDYCKPFDKKRNGMILGEGAAFFVLETEAHALSRGIRPLAVVGSLGLSCDAYHPTAPLPDGSGMRKAMSKALQQDGLSTESLGWICAHGSGTLASDAAEALAIAGLCGDTEIPVSGYKGAFGHALGAASAMQVGLCIQSLQKNQVAPMVNCSDPDERFNIRPVMSVMDTEVNHVLNCGYAFGGINSALVISKYNA